MYICDYWLKCRQEGRVLVKLLVRLFIKIIRGINSRSWDPGGRFAERTAMRNKQKQWIPISFTGGGSMKSVGILKGQCQRFFASGFSHESSSPKPLKITLGSFQIFWYRWCCWYWWQICLLCQRHLWQIATGINDIGGEIAASINDTSGK